MNDPKGYRIERFDPAALTGDDLRRAIELQQELMRERMPEDPVTPADAIAARMRADTPGQWKAFFGARDERGDVAGYGAVFRSLNEPENAHLRWTELGVHPKHRRRGVGRALLRRLVEAVSDQGDDLVFMAHVTDRVPAGADFARAIGAAAGLDMKTNQLDLAGLDRDKIAEWSAIDPAGYRIERIDGRVPDHLLKAYIQSSGGMNDAPRGALKMGDWILTEEQIRDRESWFAQAGVEWWLVVAVHDESGEGAGFTEVTYDPRAPHVIWQQGTAVTDAHRGHRIGLWMKAVMLKRILDERPDARVVRTGNANTNAQMLAINAQLGFRPAFSAALWQVSLADARRSLGLERAGATA
jgi:GNAT superfamily N-acetyltransferase